MPLLPLIASLLFGGPALAFYNPCGHIDQKGMDTAALWVSCLEANLDNCDCLDGESCCPSVVEVDGVQSCQMVCKAAVPQQGGGPGGRPVENFRCPYPELPEGINYWNFIKSCEKTPQCSNCNSEQMCCHTVGADNQCTWGCATPVKRVDRKACPHIRNIENSSFRKSCYRGHSTGGRGGRGGRSKRWVSASKCPGGCSDDLQCCTTKTEAGTCTHACTPKLDVTPKSGSCPNPVDADFLKLNKIYCYISRKQGLVAETDCRHDGDCEGNRKCCSPTIAEDDKNYAKCRRVCSTPVGEDEEEDDQLEM